jgi:prepilin-type N-terminal cleavage/methylation domain-containing protein
MKFNIFKRAFSLTELLIVLVIVAVLFAAMLPIFTKRGRGQTSGNEPVWMFVKDDPYKSAYYDPGSSAYTSTAFVGFDPKATDVKPYSKMVLRAKTNQNMIQFRTGNDGHGTLAGVFTVTPQNFVLGSKMAGDATDNFNTLVRRSTYNTVLGMSAASKLKDGQTGSLSTVVGASSSLGDTILIVLGSNLYFLQ